MPERDKLYRGAGDPLTGKWQLQAGPLSFSFQDGDLRYIRFGEVEILRRIYFAVRDPNWGTLPMRIENLRCENGPNAFHILYDAFHQQGEIDLAWKVAIDGGEDGITFLIEGEAANTFQINRLGFCVLHPIEPCRGKPCWVEKVDGSREESEFPELISPIPPISEIRAISHEIRPGMRAEVRLEGDVFEMEDQRNFGDASYKIYARLSSLPKPFEIQERARIRQEVELRLRDGPMPHVFPATAKGAHISIDPDSRQPMPALGLRATWKGEMLGQKQIERLRVLNLSHLRVDLKLSDPGYGQALERVADQAQALGLPLEVALFCSEAAEAELKQLVMRLASLAVRVQAWLIFHSDRLVTPTGLVRLARQHLQTFDPAAAFGGGTNYAFAQVNMDRPFLQGWDFLCFPTSPQMHLSDDDTLVENLAGAGYCVESARHFARDLAIRVTPVCLKPHFFAPISYKNEAAINGVDIDPRQGSLLGAGWTVGSLKALGEASASSATYFSIAGKGGIMEAPRGTAAGGKASAPSANAVYPVYHIFADVGEFSGGEVLRACSSDPLIVQALALRGKDRIGVLLANLTSELQRVSVRNLPSQVLVRTLDEDSAVEAMQEPEAYRSRTPKDMKTRDGALELELKPYAILRLIG
jgi:hypothetical protein